MRHYFLYINIFLTFLSSCKIKTINEREALNKSNKSDSIKLRNESVTASSGNSYQTLRSDSLLNLLSEDTADCGAIINTLFHRSSYKFPMADIYKREELTAVIESAKDSMLLVKVMLVDSATDHRDTVDWMNLNCKNKRLETVPLYGPDPKPIQVDYDERLLDILMRKCSLDYSN